MSAQSTIAKLRDEITKARARGASDAEVITMLTSALTPDQLIDLHKQAVTEDRTSLEAHVQKALYDRASGGGATGAILATTKGAQALTSGYGTFDPIPKDHAMKPTRKSASEDAHESEIVKNMRKVRADIRSGGLGGAR